MFSAPHCDTGHQQNRGGHDALVKSQCCPQQAWQTEVSEWICFDRSGKPTSKDNQHHNQKQNKQAGDLGNVLTVDRA